MSKQCIAYFTSPIGILEIKSTDEAIISCKFKEKKEEITLIPQILEKAINQLDMYFKGKRKNFDLKLSLIGTDFQKKIWQELQKIPFGQIVSYKEIAKRIGNKNAVRAVGNANGKNPISIIIPCHRVVGSEGKLVGYGGGLEKKRWLIDFEKTNQKNR